MPSCLAPAESVTAALIERASLGLVKTNGTSVYPRRTSRQSELAGLREPPYIDGEEPLVPQNPRNRWGEHSSARDVSRELREQHIDDHKRIEKRHRSKRLDSSHRSNYFRSDVVDGTSIKKRGCARHAVILLYGAAPCCCGGNAK